MWWRTVTTPVMFAAGAVLLSGCATIMSDPMQTISFQTVPDDVVVTLIRDVLDAEAPWEEKSGPTHSSKPKKQETRILGKTPFTLQLDRAEGQSVIFAKAGYTSVTMPLTTDTNPAVWGNILVGGLFGTTTDGISGAIYEYVPNQYVVTLDPAQASAIERETLRSHREQVRLFVFRRYASLMSDLSRGHGEDLGAVFTLLSVDRAHEDATQHQLSALAQRYPDPIVFATHVAARDLTERGHGMLGSVAQASLIRMASLLFIAVFLYGIPSLLALSRSHHTLIPSKAFT